MTTATVVFSVTCWVLIARGMISSTATIGCGNNVNWITLVPIKFGQYLPVPAFGTRMVCKICGAIGADARPYSRCRAGKREPYRGGGFDRNRYGAPFAGPDTLISSDFNMESDDGKRYCEVVQFDERLWVYSAAKWRKRRFRSHLGR